MKDKISLRVTLEGKDAIDFEKSLVNRIAKEKKTYNRTSYAKQIIIETIKK